MSGSLISTPPRPLPLGEERDVFIAEVFANYRQLIDQVGRFLERLHQRQREEFPVIQNIGDIFLDAALDWGDAFIRYIVNYPLARTRVRREMSINPRFAAFVEVSSDMSGCPGDVIYD
jgi:RhoGEF domain